MQYRRLAIIRQKYRFDGGAERFISQTLKALDKKNLELNIITRKWQEEKKDWHIYICNPVTWSRISREKNFAKTVKSIWQTQKFDIVQSHERIPGCDIYRAGDGVHRRWLIQRSRILPKWRKKILMYDNYHRYIMNIEREMYQSSSLKAIICNAKMIKEEIIEDFNIDIKKIHVIYNSIDSNYFIPADSTKRAILRKKLKFPINATIFCFIGSGFERKGLYAAIKTIVGTPFYLIIIGQDKFEKRYQALVKSFGYQQQIRFLGAQTQVLPFYHLSDGLLLPTLYDPFPNVILEAMSCGLPVITSNNCGGIEFIEQGRNGFFCDALNIKQLKEAIIATPSLNKNNEMGMVSRNKIKQLTLKNLSSKLISLYQNI